MENSDSYPIKDPKEMTLRQLLNGLSRLKISALLSILGIFIAYSFAVFRLGCELQNREAAIGLSKPFDMSLALDQNNLNELKDTSTLELKKIYLLPDAEMPLQGDRFLLQVRKIVDDYNTEPVGKIAAQKGRMIDIPKISSFFASLAAYAQEQFEWYGHENNYQFREEFLDQYTIRRYYDDGWVLEYQVDQQGRSIPSSFRWIEKY